MERMAIVEVSDPAIAQIRRALPPEHTVVAEQRVERHATTRLLVRGPLLPEIATGADAAEVQMIFTMHTEDGTKLRMTAHFSDGSMAGWHSPMWEVGSWPSLADFQRDRW